MRRRAVIYIRSHQRLKTRRNYYRMPPYCHDYQPLPARFTGSLCKSLCGISKGVKLSLQAVNLRSSLTFLRETIVHILKNDISIIFSTTFSGNHFLSFRLRLKPTVTKLLDYFEKIVVRLISIFLLYTCVFTSQTFFHRVPWPLIKKLLLPPLLPPHVISFS